MPELECFGKSVMRSVTIALCTIALACSGDAGASDGSSDARNQTVYAGYRGTPLATPVAKVPFVLSDTEGQPFDFVKETEGYLTFLFFGFTNCPDVCPVQLANLGVVLADQPLEIVNQVKVVFVSTDPERDSPERVRSWLDGFNRDFIGLLGPLDEVNQIQTKLGLPPAVAMPSEDGGEPMIGHAAAVLAFTKDGQAHLSYPFGTRQRDWAHDLPRLVQESWASPS